MVPTSDKIKLTILGAILFPCFAHINLNGTNFEYDTWSHDEDNSIHDGR